MNRREFLKAVALTGVATSLKWGDSMDLFAQTLPASTSGCDLVAVMGGRTRRNVPQGDCGIRRYGKVCKGRAESCDKA